MCVCVRERECERERVRERESGRESERERKREINGDREREREREQDRDIEREGERDSAPVSPRVPRLPPLERDQAVSFEPPDLHHRSPDFRQRQHQSKTCNRRFHIRTLKIHNSLQEKLRHRTMFMRNLRVNVQ